MNKVNVQESIISRTVERSITNTHSKRFSFSLLR